MMMHDVESEIERSPSQMIVAIASFELLVGILIAGVWITLLSRQQVREIRLERRDIWFHIAAELVTAFLLVGAGMNALMILNKSDSRALGVAAGALLYTTINSAGYYADRRQHQVVGMFGVLALLTLIMIVLLVSMP